MNPGGMYQCTYELVLEQELQSGVEMIWRRFNFRLSTKYQGNAYSDSHLNTLRLSERLESGVHVAGKLESGLLIDLTKYVWLCLNTFLEE